MWMERFGIECEDFEASVDFQVFDKTDGDGDDVLIGTLRVDAKTLATRKPMRRWFKLEAPEKKNENDDDPLTGAEKKKEDRKAARKKKREGESKKKSGELDLCLHWRHSPEVKIPPLALEMDPPAPPDRQLNCIRVQVMRCRGLKPVKSRSDAAPFTASPRVRVQVGNLPQMVTETRKNTLNPDYRADYVFDDVYDPSLIVEITVEHTDDEKGSKKERLGGVRIPLRALAHRRAFRRWLPLEDKKGRVDAKLGRIELCCRWTHNYDLEVELEEEGRKDVHVSKEPNELFCCLIRARNLALQDRKKKQQSGQSDPFAILTCAGRAQKSSVKKATLNPRWVERLAWDADDVSDVLDVSIKDACHMSGHAFLGKCIVPMEDLRRRVAARRWFPLKDEENYRDRDRGEVELLLHWHHNPDVKPRRFLEENDDFDPFPERKPNCLVVVLVRAKKLRNLEKYVFNPGSGHVDPVCRIVFDGCVKTSSTRTNEKNPHWNESFRFPDVEDLKRDRDREHHVDIVIEDVDRDGEKELVGSCRVPAAPFADRRPHRAWHWLDGPDDPAPRPRRPSPKVSFRRPLGSRDRTTQVCRAKSSWSAGGSTTPSSF